ncbi:MAG: AAA family ATPase [Marinicellaceae bacterium]
MSDNSNLPHIQALGLKYNPFPVVPDSDNYFTTEEMFSKINDILHCIDARKGFILISGEVGLGKTTLSRLLLEKLELKKINTSLVLNTFLQSGSLLKAINNDFNIQIESEEISDQLEALNGFLLTQYSQDKNCVIVIDDAQQLSLESLELVRQLSNLETNQNKLVQIILVAQSEIMETLDRNDMRQLKSRIALNLHINPLNPKELEQYIDFRLARAGSSGQISLEKNALKLLHKLTNGYPRRVNLVMDRCLYVVAAFKVNKINKNLIAKAHDEVSVTSIKTRKVRTVKAGYALAAVFLVTIVFFGYHYQDVLMSKFNHNNLETASDNKNQEIDLINLANVKQSFMLSESENSLRKEPVDKQMTESMFLMQFGVESLTKEFTLALENQDFFAFENEIFNQSGLKILVNSSEIKSNNSNEIWKFSQAGKDHWLTLWRPQLTLSAFYKGYYSEDVLQLQRSLQSEGFYRSIVDGVVGEKTIVAIANFQKTVGVNASGFPNELTLYQLQKLNESSLNIGNEVQQINEKRKTKSSNKKVNSKPTYSLANNTIITDSEQ